MERCHNDHYGLIIYGHKYGKNGQKIKLINVFHKKLWPKEMYVFIKYNGISNLLKRIKTVENMIHPTQTSEQHLRHINEKCYT